MLLGHLLISSGTTSNCLIDYVHVLRIPQILLDQQEEVVRNGRDVGADLANAALHLLLRGREDEALDIRNALLACHDDHAGMPKETPSARGGEPRGKAPARYERRRDETRW